MQQGFQMYAFNGLIDPLINKLSGDSKLKSTGLKLFTTGLFTTVGMSLCNISEGSSKIFEAIGKTSFYSLISEGLISSIDKLKNFVTVQLEKYDLEDTAELVGAGLEIGAGLLLRQAAGAAVDYLPEIRNPFWKEKNVASVDFSNIIHPSTANTGGFFNKIGSIINPILNLGKSTQYSESNFLSDALDSCGSLVLLSGVVNFGKAMWNIFTSSNKIHGLSVYDIRKILKATVGDFITREQINAEADKMFQKIQETDAVFSKLTEQQQVQVSSIQKLYDTAYGEKMKTEYKTIIPTKLFDKADNFVNMQIQMQVIDRMTSKQMYIQQIKQISQYYDIKPILDTQSKIANQFVNQKLNNELQQLETLSQNVISQEDKNVYKTLFADSTKWEIIYEGVIEYIQQHDVEEFNV